MRPSTALGRTSLVCVVAIAASIALVSAQRAAPTLDIYVVDVEGGNATLFVSPSGESLLIDAGNGGAAAARDADRIMAAVNDAGPKQIGNLVITHYPGDHFGGVPEFASRIPVRNFIDHGPNVQPAQAADAFLKDVYPGLYAKSRHTVAKPGDRSAVPGLDIRVLSAAGQVIKTPLPGAGKPNPYCGSFKPQDPDP